MTSLLITAFIMGGIGSFHCIGMCGPIALSLPVMSEKPSSRFLSTFLYNIGRVTTYACIGAFFGMAGSTFALFGIQQWLSILIGFGILLFLFFPKLNIENKITGARFFQHLRKQIGQLFSRKSYRSVFLVGLLNGMLPCGLVYMAVAGALSTASVSQGSLFMAAFGMGTLPIMWSLAFFGSYITLSVRQGIKKVYPYILAGMALLFILRGMGLNIPYISPSLDEHKAISAREIRCHD